MNTRLLSATAVATVLAGTGWLTTSVLQAQAQAPAATRKAAPIARTADGHPDLQGMFDVATITPLERPAEFGDRGSLTREEAMQLETAEKEWRDKSLAPDQANRDAPPVGGETDKPKSFLATLFRGGGGVVGGYNTFWLAGGDQVVTINGQMRTSIIVDPPNGRIPPRKPAALAKMQKLLAARVDPNAAESESSSGPASAFDNPEARPLAERCLLGFGNTSGPPTLPNYFYNNLKQIVQTKDTILIHVEMVHDARIIRMNATHLPSSVRKWMGDSTGRWEGDTLVVDTTNFTDKTVFAGSAENLHVIERFTPVDGNTLLYQFTVEDSETWDRPWKGEYTWRRTDELLYEYACHEGNHALSNVLSGARFSDKQGKKP